MCALQNKMSPFALVLAFSVFAASVSTVGAGSFLKKSEHEEATPEKHDMSESAEKALLDEMQKELGSNHRHFTDTRLQHIKENLRPLFEAMQKNAAGKLDLPAVNYVLRRSLLDRHAWFVKGLEPESKSWAAWKESDPMFLLKQHVSENVTSIFESRFKYGLDMNEIAVLLTSLEHLVHKDSWDRVAVAYAALNLSEEESLSQEEAREVLDVYMSMLIVGPLLGESGKVKTNTPEVGRKIREKILDIYPTFNDTQQFVRDLQESILPNRDTFYAADVAAVVEGVQDGYGRWQNKECLNMKAKLMEIEDQGVSGAGRVRLADFYDAAINNGKWEFVEAPHYLRTIGALDDTDPNDWKVIIPNYVNAPTNCVAGTGYYSVCCIDECDGLLSHLEKAFRAPEATPEQIIDVVRALPSSSAPAANPAPWLVRRLQEIAQHHGGSVPLHGRLFGQWMHYAYPRECTYPHRHGETKMQRPREYKQESKNNYEMPQEEMKELIAKQKPRVYMTVDSMGVVNGEVDDEVYCPMWTKDEELVVSRPELPAASSMGSFDIQTSARCAMFLLLLGSAAMMLAQLARGSLMPASKDKKETSSQTFFA